MSKQHFDCECEDCERQADHTNLILEQRVEEDNSMTDQEEAEKVVGRYAKLCRKRGAFNVHCTNELVESIAQALTKARQEQKEKDASVVESDCSCGVECCTPCADHAKAIREGE